MGALRIIAAIIMAIFTINIVRGLIVGESKVAAWKKGAITDQDGAKLRLRFSRSLRFSFGFLVLAMAAFFFSD